MNERTKREFIGFFLVFYLMPIALMYFRIFPAWTHAVFLVLMGLLMFAYVTEKKISLKRDLGFRTDNLAGSLAFSLVLTGLISFILLIMNATGLIRPSFGKALMVFYPFYILVSAPLQEFIFRSVMIYELKRLMGEQSFLPVLFASAFIFSFAHIYYHSFLVLVVTFIMGLVWGLMYLGKPNFYAVSISHAIIGAVAVFIGIV